MRKLHASFHAAREDPMMPRLFLGRYSVVRLLGEGGMGKVYLAQQTDNGREVVVKVMHEKFATQAKFRDLFEREMQCMARFQHPNVVALYEASPRDPAGMCIVMEYVPGVDIEQLLARERRL